MTTAPSLLYMLQTCAEVSVAGLYVKYAHWDSAKQAAVQASPLAIVEPRDLKMIALSGAGYPLHWTRAKSSLQCPTR